MKRIELNVIGIPHSQGSKSAFVNPKTGRAVIKEAGGAKHKNWRAAIREVVQRYLEEHPQPPLDEPLSVRIEFRYPVVASDPYRTRHATSPDDDKATRAVWDALKEGGLIRDDSRFWTTRVRSVYVEPGQTVGATIIVVTNGDTEMHDRERKKRAAKLAPKPASTVIVERDV